MPTLHYIHRQIICNLLKPYVQIEYANAEIKNRAAFDRDNDQYLIISQGWQNKNRHHSCLLPVEIIKGKVWIQCDNTEDGIANDLVVAGIPKQDIVLGFHEPNVRQYTGFAIA